MTQKVPSSYLILSLFFKLEKTLKICEWNWQEQDPLESRGP